MRNDGRESARLGGPMLNVIHFVILVVAAQALAARVDRVCAVVELDSMGQREHLYAHEQTLHEIEAIQEDLA